MPEPSTLDDVDEPIAMEVSDREMRELLGLFDSPSFARRGQAVEWGLKRLHERCQRQRMDMLDMVRLRLRQWASAVEGPQAWPLCFDTPIEDLWPLSGADQPSWNTQPSTPRRRRRAIARDLIASLERFNRRWTRFLDELNLAPLNTAIEDFNRYYILEKECVVGSARLAARHFQRVEPISVASLLAEHPPLPVPGLRLA